MVLKRRFADFKTMQTPKTIRVIDELSKVIVGSGYVRLGIACGAESVESVLYYHPYYYSRVLVIETMLELHLLRNRTKLWLRPCVLQSIQQRRQHEISSLYRSFFHFCRVCNKRRVATADTEASLQQEELHVTKDQMIYALIWLLHTCFHIFSCQNKSFCALLASKNFHLEIT